MDSLTFFGVCSISNLENRRISTGKKWPEGKIGVQDNREGASSIADFSKD
jgi:hypothetical protein